MADKRNQPSGLHMHHIGIAVLCALVLCISIPLNGCRDVQKELVDYIEAGNLDGVRSIIDPNPGLVSANTDGQGGNTLFVATASGKGEIVEYLISKGADVNGRNINGLRPLHIAALKSRTRIAGILIGKGADVNIQDNEGKTPLHDAVLTDRREMIELLISKGAGLTILDAGGRTPLFYSRTIITASILITAGSNPKIKDYKGMSSSQWAATQGYPDVARFLTLQERMKE